MILLVLILAIPIHLLFMFFIRITLEYVIVIFKIAEVSHSEEKGILKSLFDTNFDVFLTPRLIKIIYKIFLFGLPIIYIFASIILINLT